MKKLIYSRKTWSIIADILIIVALFTSVLVNHGLRAQLAEANAEIVELKK